MNVGLIDVDGHNFPNLALMKISTYYKNKGDKVEFVNPLFGKYDVVYQSKVFDFTPDFNECIKADQIIKGGTGYGLRNTLPDEIEHATPDYSLYNTPNTAYGFLTRGCPRGCKFCIVPEKEGKKSCKVADLSEFRTGQKEIVLLDPNITACDDCENLFQELADSKVPIDFSQGLDIRFMTDKKANLLNEMEVKMLHFAWDNYEFSTYNSLKEFRSMLKYDSRRLRVYVLTNFNTTFEQDLERIYKLRELDYDPYVMIFDKHLFVNQETHRLYPVNLLLKKFTIEQIEHFRKVWRMSRWVNSKFIWRSCEKFEDYN